MLAETLNIPPNNTLKMLGVTLDDKLNFKTHIRNVCQKAYRQINALKRISKFLNEQCRMHVYKSFVSANFNYCLVVWMFCGKKQLRKTRKTSRKSTFDNIFREVTQLQWVIEEKWPVIGEN